MSVVSYLPTTWCGAAAPVRSSLGVKLSPTPGLLVAERRQSRSNPASALVHLPQPEWLGYLLASPLLTKYALTKPTHTLNLTTNVTKSYRPFRASGVCYNNLVPTPAFTVWVKRRALRVLVELGRFLPNVVMWFYHTLIRFVEISTGKRALLKVNPFVENSLSVRELARCTM